MREANEGWARFVEQLVNSRYAGKQSALAEAVGVSPSTVTRWIDGATPAIQQLRALSDTLDYTMVDLLRAAGALDASDGGGEVSAPAAILADVAEAIRQDVDLLEEAKQHLLNQYELLLRLPRAAARTRVEKTARRATSPDASPSLRAVARGGDPKDRGEVRRIAREARRQHDRKSTGKDR